MRIVFASLALLAAAPALACDDAASAVRDQTRQMERQAREEERDRDRLERLQRERNVALDRRVRAADD